MTFDDFFRAATRNEAEPQGRDPYPYQERFATAADLPHLVCASTGAGKTATAVLGWLYRRTTSPSATPRRLVYCLPMRVLVEQSRNEATKWIANLGLTIPVYALMGGVEREKWFLHPEEPAVLIGTQDMLLSRALNRGYAASRFHWPIDFGLLNNDCLWVFDEPQLMANGVSTSAQLAGLRHALGTAAPCPAVWMSATLEPGWLDTVDFRGKFPGDPLELTDADYDPALPLHKRMTAKKLLGRLDATASKDGKDVAKAVWEKHQEGTQTLVVLNTVDRAKAVYAELNKLRKNAGASPPLLIHSRFRPKEREQRNTALTDKGATANRIIVATQVVEAGVDISARTLVTELAPWASVVQRIGRCNRTGDDGPGRVYWIDQTEVAKYAELKKANRPQADVEQARKEAEKSSLPYSADELMAARDFLEALDGQDVSPRALDDFKKSNGIELLFEHAHVIRRRDVLDLFDTAPDLSGNDIDIARFVRSDDPDTDVQVFWRPGPPSNDWDAAERRRQAARRVELCSVPIGSFKKEFLEAGKTAYRWDFLEGVWEEVARKDARSVVPGQTFWVTADQGGYDIETGWSPDRGALAVEHLIPVPGRPPRRRYDRPEGYYGSDEWAQQREWRTVAEHTDEVVVAMAEILAPEAGLSVPADDGAALRVAARWHDWGKAHAVFQSGLCDDIPDPQARKENPTARRDDLPRLRRPEDYRTCPDIAKAPQEFWRKYTRVVSPAANGRDERRATVKRFRHELASALGVIRLLADGGAPRDWAGLTPAATRLALYLIAAHHGKVRLSIRTMPDDSPVPSDPGKTAFACGIWEDDPLPAADLGDGVRAEGVRLTLAPMRIGRDGWTAAALDLLDRYGPFRLAYLEALLRAADCRASDPGEEDSDA